MEQLYLKQKPYSLLLLSGLALIATSLFTQKNETVDFHIHDTVFVIAQGHLLWFLALTICGLWLLYLITRKLLYSRTLTWTHILVNLITLTALLFLLLFKNGYSAPHKEGTLDQARWNEFNEFSQHMTLINLCVMVLIAGQFIYVINLIFGVIKRLALYGKSKAD